MRSAASGWSDCGDSSASHGWLGGKAWSCELVTGDEGCVTARLNRRRFGGRTSAWSDAARRCSWEETGLALPPLELSAAGLAMARVEPGRGEAPCRCVALLEFLDCHSAIASSVTSLAGIYGRTDERSVSSGTTAGAGRALNLPTSDSMGRRFWGRFLPSRLNTPSRRVFFAHLESP